MSPEDPAWLREQAKRCRWLAATATDPRESETLRLMAHDYEKKAAELSRACPAPPSPLSDG